MMKAPFRPVTTTLSWSGLVLLAVVFWVFTAKQSSWIFAKNTLIVVGGTLVIALPVGTLCAVLLWRTRLPGASWLKSLFLWPLFVPLYLHVGAWIAGFHMLGWFTLVTGTKPLLQNMQACIWIHALAAIPWAIAIVGLGLSHVERELEDTAQLDQSPWGVFWSVTLRRAAGSIVAATVLIATLTAGEITVTDMFQVRTLAEQLYYEVALEGSPGPATLQVLPSLLVQFALGAWLMSWVLGGKFLPGLAVPAGVHLWKLGWRGAVASYAFLGSVAAVVLGVPLVNLMLQAGSTVTHTAAGKVRAWSLAKCAKLVWDARPAGSMAGVPATFADEWWMTLRLSVLATAAAVAAGIVLAAVARRKSFWAQTVLALTCALLAVPGSLLGVAIIWGLNQPDVPVLLRLYDHPIFAPVLALFLKSLPWCTLVLWYVFYTVDDDQLDAAQTDGANAIARVWSILIMQRWGGVALAGLVGFVICFGDLSASTLVVPPGPETLSRNIFGLLHSGADDRVSGICLMQFGLFAVLAVLARSRVFLNGGSQKNWA